MKIINTIRFYWDYYIGAFLHAKNNPNYHIDLIYKYPERFKREIKYLEDLKRKDL